MQKIMSEEKNSNIELTKDINCLGQYPESELHLLTSIDKIALKVAYEKVVLYYQ